MHILEFVQKTESHIEKLITYLESAHQGASESISIVKSDEKKISGLLESDLHREPETSFSQPFPNRKTESQNKKTITYLKSARRNKSNGFWYFEIDS